MKVIVVGCGRVGSTLAGLLAAEGHDVAVVDRRSKAARRLPDSPRIRFHEGNGYSRAVLRTAGIEHADAFVAVTSGDNSNIVSARTGSEEEWKDVVDRMNARGSGVADKDVPLLAQYLAKTYPNKK